MTLDRISPLSLNELIQLNLDASVLDLLTRQIQQTQARHTRGTNAQFNLLSPEDLYNRNNPPVVEVKRASDGNEIGNEIRIDIGNEVGNETPRQARLIDSLLPVMSHTGPENNEMIKDIDSSNVDQKIEEIQPPTYGHYFLDLGKL